MAKVHKRKAKTIPMKVGNDSKLWRFASLEEALQANTHLIASVICAAQEMRLKSEITSESAETMPILEEV